MPTPTQPAALPAPAPASLAPVHRVEARRVYWGEKAPVRGVVPGSAVDLIHDRLMERMGRCVVEGVRA